MNARLHVHVSPPLHPQVAILRTIFHPFIVNLFGHMQDERRLYMLLEFVPGGELFSHLRREVRLGDSATRFYASEVVLAFEYLHALSIVYRDLKPENLLLTASGHLKIGAPLFIARCVVVVAFDAPRNTAPRAPPISPPADFGFAKIVTDRTYSLCGTPEYLAPEIIHSTGHSMGVDW